MGLKRENHMIIMILWSGLSHYIFYTLFLQSSLTQIMPRLHITYSFKAGVTSTLCLWRRSRYFYIQNLIIFHNCWLEIILKILEILVSSIHSLHQVQQLSATKVFAHNNLLELCYSVTMSERHSMIVNQLLKQQNGCVFYSWSCFSEFNPTVYTSGWSMPLGFLLCD